jgi:hypothetical protein
MIIYSTSILFLLTHTKQPNYYTFFSFFMFCFVYNKRRAPWQVAQFIFNISERILNKHWRFVIDRAK